VDKRAATFGLVAGVLGLAADGFYLWVIRTQENSGEPWRVIFVALFIGLLAIAVTLGAARSSARVAVFLLGFAAIGFLTLVVLAGMSIGILLLPSAVLAIIATMVLIRGVANRAVALGLAGLGAVVAWGILIAGFTLVSFGPPGCPGGGHHIEGSIHEGGHVTTFTCDNGRLVTWHRS
jgi:hypothetical protein